METTKVESVAHYNNEEIDQLIVDMMADGWKFIKIENDLIYFKKEVKDPVGYKQEYED